MAAAARAAKVVQRCLADVARHPIEHVDVYLEDDITTWHIALHFPASAPFAGGEDGMLIAADFTLYVTLHFGEEFPARPPRLKFLSPWTNHQHLWGDRICHSLLTDDFLDYFVERRTHGTSMWNASCALADSGGLGGMPRYLQVLRDYLASDPDYNEEQHVRYNEVSLRQDVAKQRSFRPDWLSTACLLEPEVPGRDAQDTISRADQEGASLPLESAASSPIELRTTECLEAPLGDAQQACWGTDFFLKTPLIAGNAETHPCFDVTLTLGFNPSLSTSMTNLCRRSFEMGARTTDFGSQITTFLPFPCSSMAWETVGSDLTKQALEQLQPIADRYRLNLTATEQETQAASYEGMLGVIGEIWKTTCIGIVKDEGYESERAMMCFVTLHYLLLCLAEEHTGLRAYATATVREFLDRIQSEPTQNLKSSVPDLGRFLVRFLLTEADAPFRENAPLIVRELFSRNVRWVKPDYWANADASPEDKDEQVLANFEASQFGMKLTVFQSYYILRSVELGLNTLEAHEVCGGKPSADILRVFQQDCRGIKELESFQEFFLWLQLDDLAFGDIHAMLVSAVEESEGRGYNAGLPPRS